MSKPGLRDVSGCLTEDAFRLGLKDLKRHGHFYFRTEGEHGRALRSQSDLVNISANATCRSKGGCKELGASAFSISSAAVE